MIASIKLRVAVLLVFALVPVLLTTATDDNDPKLVRWRMQRILKEVSETVEKNYYDPKMNGLDWKASAEIARQR